MDLGGRISVIEPILTFQFCNTCRLTGLLKFISPEQGIADFYLQDGDIIFATLDQRKKIGEYLLEKRVITKSQLKKSLRIFRREKGVHRIGEILVALGFIEQADLAKALREQMEEAVYEVLTWQEGDFIFVSNQLPEEEDVFLDNRMDMLILEGCRRIDESR